MCGIFLAWSDFCYTSENSQKFPHVHSYRSSSEFLFIPVNVAKICKLVHVVRIFMGEPIVCGKQNKMSHELAAH